MNGSDTIRDADPGPCDECGHEWHEHTGHGWCHGWTPGSNAAYPDCDCFIHKGKYTHFGLRMLGGRYFRDSLGER